MRRRIGSRIGGGRLSRMPLKADSVRVPDSD
jgi:hypothetical protein